MAVYLGDYNEDDTLYFEWHTVGADGASITRATNGEVRVYKDNGVDQSTAGITDSEDFDGLTGTHACTIDLSAHAFYATGADYSVVLQGAVIDGVTVNAVLGNFSIENRAQAVSDQAAAVAPVGLTLAVLAPEVVGNQAAAVAPIALTLAIPAPITPQITFASPVTLTLAVPTAASRANYPTPVSPVALTLAACTPTIIIGGVGTSVSPVAFTLATCTPTIVIGGVGTSAAPVALTLAVPTPEAETARVVSIGGVYTKKYDKVVLAA